jgi:hypothetical protein
VTEDPKYLRDGYGFENGSRVPITWPNMVEFEPEERGSALAVLDIARRGLVYVTEGGHRDSAQSRAAALACLFGIYASPTEAANRLNLSVSTVSRALSELRSEFLRNDSPLVGTDVPEQK